MLFSYVQIFAFLIAIVIPEVAGGAIPSRQLFEKRGDAKIQAAYFTNWGIYGANFQPTDINTTPLTHILYAFADIQSDGTISLTDPYADEQKHYPGDSWNDSGNNLYGCLKQLYLIKLKQRNIKTLLSIGGWTYSQDNHFAFVDSDTERATFVNSAVQIVKDYGFDGIDIDFEYPADTSQGQNFADLLTSLRSAFDALAQQNGDTEPYQITAAVPAAYSNYISLNVPQMDAALTYWNVMSYDYAGSWLTWADHQANLYGGERTNVSTDKALSWYLANGASPGKVNMGIPLYGRSFEKTDGIGEPYDGVGPATYPYSTLPMAGSSVTQDLEDVASYSYDDSSKELVSYDSPDIVALKANYVIDHGLAGNMFWDLSSDKTNSPDSLVSTTANIFGELDQTQNHINYPDSKWDNIRSNMAPAASDAPPPPSSSSSSSSPPPPPPSATDGSNITPTPSNTAPSDSSQTNSAVDTSPPAGGCSTAPAWDPNTAYVGGSQVTYNGGLWTAKWWTQNDKPGGAADVWVDGGPCVANSKRHRSSFARFVIPFGHS